VLAAAFPHKQQLPHCDDRRRNGGCYQIGDARMTENYDPPVSAPVAAEPLAVPPEASHGTADIVRDQAAELGRSGAEAGKHAADVAREQASEVAAEAGRQGMELLREAQSELSVQAGRGQQRLASELLSVSDELLSMADGSVGQGRAAGLARRASAGARAAGRWLEDRQPAQVVNEIQSFARRKPGAFLALAAAAGLAAGRLTRGMQAGNTQDPWAGAAATEAAAASGAEGAQAPVLPPAPAGNGTGLIADNQLGAEGTL
jgi:hypothetical protein